MNTIHCIVSGRVQGVFYRAKAAEKATELGITGWVQNLEDGRVEVMASGEAEQLDIFQEWLWRGPMLAKVTAVSCEPMELLEFPNFQVNK